MNHNETIIALYPKNKPRKTFSSKIIKTHIKKDIIFHSIIEIEKFSFVNYKIPLTYRFYEIHSNNALKG